MRGERTFRAVASAATARHHSAKVRAVLGGAAGLEVLTMRIFIVNRSVRIRHLTRRVDAYTKTGARRSARLERVRRRGADDQDRFYHELLRPERQPRAVHGARGAPVHQGAPEGAAARREDR